MQIQANGLRYQWHDRWADIPDTPTGQSNGRTHGIVVTRDRRVIVFHQASPAVLVLDPQGNLLQSWGERFTGAHGLTLVGNGEATPEALWLTDQHSAEVVKTTLEGETVLGLAPPSHAAYDRATYKPTWVAENETRWGGDGHIWVADGYGASLVHRYDAEGNYLSTLDGTEGDAGRFKCPHGIAFDTRRGRDTPPLLIADRGNHRVQVYDAGGNYQRCFGETELTSPCMFASDGMNLYIPELFGSIAVIGPNDRKIANLGANFGIKDVAGWPQVPADRIEPGKFNSPHGCAVDPSDGSVFVAEWIIGGRIIKLQRD